MLSLDPNDPKVRYKRQQIASLINFTEQQKIIVDLYILEESTGKRHWEMDPEDPNIYLEWMNGVNILRNKVNAFKALSARQQKAMYNNVGGQQQEQEYGNNPQTGQGQGQGQAPSQFPQHPTGAATTTGAGGTKTLKTSSGREISSSDRPDLARLASRPKRNIRRSR